MSAKIKVSPVSASVPFDTTTTIGSTFPTTVQSAQDAIEYLRQQTQGATGVTPPFLFSRQGATGNSSYLQVGNVFSNQAGQVIPGTNKIVKITITTSQAYNQAQTVQIQTRTGVSTFVDLSGAAITIPGDNSTYSVTYIPATPITLPTNAEISAYLKTGNGIQNAVLLVYVVPV
jgi:hypothetical protein